VLLNLLLRNYLSEDLVAQADLLVSKTTFPESAPNSETARYLYYLGRIKAIQLDYSEADQHLFSAIRKAPTNAVGFLEHVRMSFREPLKLFFAPHQVPRYSSPSS